MCVHVYVKGDASMYSGMEARKRYLLFSIVPCLILEAGHLTKSELANFQLYTGHQQVPLMFQSLLFPIFQHWGCSHRWPQLAFKHNSWELNHSPHTYATNALTHWAIFLPWNSFLSFMLHIERQRGRRQDSHSSTVDFNFLVGTNLASWYTWR